MRAISEYILVTVYGTSDCIDTDASRHQLAQLEVAYQFGNLEISSAREELNEILGNGDHPKPTIIFTQQLSGHESQIVGVLKEPDWDELAETLEATGLIPPIEKSA